MERRARSTDLGQQSTSPVPRPGHSDEEPGLAVLGLLPLRPEQVRNGRKWRVYAVGQMTGMHSRSGHKPLVRLAPLLAVPRSPFCCLPCWDRMLFGKRADRD